MATIRRRVLSGTPIIKDLYHKYHSALHDKGILQIEKGNLEADIRNYKVIIDEPRAYAAHHYIKGAGIEIGAAQFPVILPESAKVKYVDIFSTEEIRKAWPIYKKLDIVDVDVVDDAEKLLKFKNSTLDFIIANHFLEHCLDPIGTLLTMYSKLRKNGVLFFAIPDKRYTFDKKRPITTYQHLLEEHKDTSKKFMYEHTKEFFTLGEKFHGNIESKVKETIDSGFRIHYHVWTVNEMLELFRRINEDFSINLEIEAVINRQYEVIFILKKCKL